jgi:EmrB/QacA subfamily drug resistance transporter
MNRSTASPPRAVNPWAIFGLAAVAQFMVVLDASIVNVALPSIQRGLHFTLEDLSWVVNIYVLMFGGFLLLGGRAGDIFGRRRLFIGGLLLFSLASLFGGLAQSPTWLIIARGAQGLGGAIISPISLAIVTGTFDEGPERNRALGIFGSIAGAAGAFGVLMGGVLTSSFGWQWVFFVNVPIGLAAAALAPLVIPADHGTGERRGFDLPGAVTVTAGLVLLVYGVVKAPDNGWTSASTLLFLSGAAALLVTFIVIELRSRDPLVRLGIFRIRSLSVTNMAGLLAGAGMFAMFYFISLYLQEVLGYSALKAGFAYLPMAFGIIVSAGLASVLVTRFGFKPILAGGLILAGLGLFWLTQIRVHGTYVQDVLLPSLTIAFGLGLTFVPLTIAAVQGVKRSEIGLASGLINTSLQVGGALGLAILSTISTSRFNDLLKSGHTPTSALVGGFHYAFFAGGVFLIAGGALVLLLLRNAQAQEGHMPEIAAQAQTGG